MVFGISDAAAIRYAANARALLQPAPAQVTAHGEPAATPHHRKPQAFRTPLSHHDRVDHNQALARLREGAALWSVDYITAADIVEIACDLLVAGQDGPTLRMLAAVPFRHADEEVPEVLESVLADLDLPYYEPGSTAGQEAAVRALAARVLAGTMPPTELAVWAHSKIGHDRLALAERLVELDDVYDTIEYSDMTEEEVDAEVVAEARRILHETHAIDPPPSA